MFGKGLAIQRAAGYPSRSGDMSTCYCLEYFVYFDCIGVERSSDMSPAHIHNHVALRRNGAGMCVLRRQKYPTYSEQ